MFPFKTGKTLQIYRGHTAPVTCMAFHTVSQGEKISELLITGSWDKVRQSVKARI